LALGSAGRDEEELAGWPTASFKSRKRAGVGADMSSGNYPRQVPVRMCCCVWSQEICGCSSELWALMMRYELLGRCCLGSELGRAGEGEEKTATDDTVKVNTETEAWWFSGQRLRPQEIALGLLPCDMESGVLLSAVGDEFRCFCPSGNVGGGAPANGQPGTVGAVGSGPRVWGPGPRFHLLQAPLAQRWSCGWSGFYR
jgi:hypothetical protein